MSDRSLAKKDVAIFDDFVVLDLSVSPPVVVTGILPAAFAVELWDPTGAEVSGSITVTITELGGGTYRATFIPNAKGHWTLVVKHATYFPWGKRGNYEVYDQDIDDISGENLGPGNRVVEVLVRDDVSLDPIVGVWVQVYNATMTTLVAFGYTKSDGKITFNLFDGSYKVVLSKIGQYVFTVPEDLTVSANPPPPDVQVTYEGTLFDPGTPPSADTCIIYGWEQDAQGTGLAVEVTAKIVGDKNFLDSNPHIVGTEITVTSDSGSSGYWSMALLKSGEFASGDRTVVYEFTIDDKFVGTAVIPDQASCPLKEILDP